MNETALVNVYRRHHFQLIPEIYTIPQTYRD